MENDLVAKETWFKRNWKWAAPATFVLIFLLGLLLTSSSQQNINDIVLAYSDNSLYEKAIKKANSDKRILQSFGTIQPIDKLAILEGNAIYSNNNNSVELSVRIKGNKGNGKLDIVAHKVGKEWKYRKIIVRDKNSKNEIVVVNDF